VIKIWRPGNEANLFVSSFFSQTERKVGKVRCCRLSSPREVTFKYQWPTWEAKGSARETSLPTYFQNVCSTKCFKLALVVLCIWGGNKDAQSWVSGQALECSYPAKWMMNSGWHHLNW